MYLLQKRYVVYIFWQHWQPNLFVQSNANLWPFHNAGWCYLKMFELIILVSGMKGWHVFVPTLATTPLTQFDEDEEAELGSARDTSSGDRGSSTMVGHGANMDIDRHDDFTTPFSKWKHISFNDADSFTSGSPGPLNTTSSLSLQPLRKKTSLTSGLQSTSKWSSKSGARTTSKLYIQASTAIAIHDMQGTLNRITDIFKKSTQDPSSTKLDKAIQWLQSTDNDLTMDEKSSMINQFIMKPSIANAYLAITDDALRVNWFWAMMAQIRLQGL